MTSADVLESQRRVRLAASAGPALNTRRTKTKLAMDAILIWVIVTRGCMTNAAASQLSVRNRNTRECSDFEATACAVPARAAVSRLTVTRVLSD